MARTVLFLAHQTVMKVAVISNGERVWGVEMVTKGINVAEVRCPLNNNFHKHLQIYKKINRNH